MESILIFACGLAVGCVVQAFGAAKVHSAIQAATLDVIDKYHRELSAARTEIARLKALV